MIDTMNSKYSTTDCNKMVCNKHFDNGPRLC